MRFLSNWNLKFVEQISLPNKFSSISNQWWKRKKKFPNIFNIPATGWATDWICPGATRCHFTISSLIDFLASSFTCVVDLWSVHLTNDWKWLSQPQDIWSHCMQAKSAWIYEYFIKLPPLTLSREVRWSSPLIPWKCFHYFSTFGEWCDQRWSQQC